MKYTIVRTDTADICIRKIVTFIARNFGEDIALKKLDDLEKNIYLDKQSGRDFNRPQYRKMIPINEQIQNIAQKKDTLCRRMYN